MTQNEFKELQRLVQKHTTDEIIVVAIPKTIRNSGKDVEVIDFAIIHKATMKEVRFVYRDAYSNLENTLKQKSEELVMLIFKEIAEPKKVQKVEDSL